MKDLVMAYRQLFDHLGNPVYKPVTNRISRRFLAMVIIAATGVALITVAWVMQ